jgi:membrane protease YdiL (CAAX protease family)
MNAMWRTDAGKAAAIIPLALALRAMGRGMAGDAVERPAAGRARRNSAAAVIALAAPAAVLAAAGREKSLRLDAPPSTIGKALLGVHVLATVGLEELIWRYPLTWTLPRRTRLGLGVLSAIGFTGVHLRRDGLIGAQSHLLNAAGWTAATMVSRSILWSTVAHGAHNLVILTARPVPTRPGP